MKKTVCILALVLALLPAIVLEAQVVSIQCIEISDVDLPSDYPPIPASSYWESGIMNAFFNAGYIVSSMPIVRERELIMTPGTIERAYEDGIDLLVIIYLSYQLRSSSDSLRNPETQRPDRLHWELHYPGARNKDRPMREYALPLSRSTREDIRNAEAFGGMIISGLKER